MGWWAITDDALMEMLREVESGASAEMVYMEHYANSAVDDSDEDGWGLPPPEHTPEP